MTSTGAVVIHHLHFPAVLRTVDAIIAQGISPGHVVVVDNSEDLELLDELRKAVPNMVTVEAVSNKGYGQAANTGAARLLKMYPTLDYILVSSHETRPSSGAIPALQQALDDNCDLGVVGPTLISERQNADPQVYWSQGGTLTRVLNQPRHVGYLAPLDGDTLTGPVVLRAWLDGAFCIYRSDVLANMGFREEFFLYFEETDLHIRMGKSGHLVGWVPGARVEQSSAGVPPFLLGRNLQLFQQLHGNRVQRACAVPTVIATRAGRRLLGRGDPGEVRQIINGWVSALR